VVDYHTFLLEYCTGVLALKLSDSSIADCLGFTPVRPQKALKLYENDTIKKVMEADFTSLRVGCGKPPCLPLEKCNM
jgi:hypothetical protein